MNKVYFILFFVTVNVFSQTGIGTKTPDASAALEVSATNKGFLPPRVALTSDIDKTTIPNPVAGLMVYNTSSSTTLDIGLHYFNGTKWISSSQIAPGLENQVLKTINSDGTLTTKWGTLDANNITGKALSSTDLDVSVDGASALLKDITLNIKADAVTSAKIKDGEIKTADIALGTANQVLKTNTDGTAVEWGTLDANNVTGKALSSTDLDVSVDGASALLKDVTLNIKADAITSAKIKNGEIKTDDIALGTANQILKTNTDGTAVEWGTLGKDNISGEALVSDDLDISINGISALLEEVTVNIKNDAIVTSKIKDGEIKTDDIALGTANQVLKTNTDGTAVEWGTLDANNVTGKALSSTDLDVSADGASALLKDVTLNIKADAITSAKIKDGEIKTDDIADKTVTVAKINAGTDNNGKILTANTDGSASWTTAPTPKVTATQVVFGDASNLATSSSNLTWDNTNKKLSVTGTVETATSIYPDYVFENYYTNKPSKMNLNYHFKTLNEVEAFIKTNGHLPGVTSYKEYLANDKKVDLAKTAIKNLEKIEELFLYIIELKKENDILKSQNNNLRKDLNNIKTILLSMEK